MMNGLRQVFLSTIATCIASTLLAQPVPTVKIGDDLVQRVFNHTTWVPCKKTEPCFGGKVTFFKGDKVVEGQTLPEGATAVKCGTVAKPETEAKDGCETPQHQDIAGCKCYQFGRPGKALRKAKGDETWMADIAVKKGFEYRCFCLRPEEPSDKPATEQPKKKHGRLAKD